MKYLKNKVFLASVFFFLLSVFSVFVISEQNNNSTIKDNHILTVKDAQKGHLGTKVPRFQHLLEKIILILTAQI